MEIGDSVGGPFEPGEPAFERDPALGKLLPLLLEASLLSRVGRRGFPVGPQNAAARCCQEAPPC